MVDTWCKGQRFGEIFDMLFSCFSYNFSNSREQGHKDKFILNKMVVTFNVNCPRAPRPWRRYRNLDWKIAFSWEVCLLPNL